MRATEPLDAEGRVALERNLVDLWDVLPPDWVFAGVLLRSDFEFYPNVDGSPWVAIATKTKNTELGPVPEIRGTGGDINEALSSLVALARDLSR